MSQLKQIESLLEKYWEGETSLEEERLLKAYFASGEVDAALRQFAPMFQVFREEKAVQLAAKPVIADLRPQQYNWRPLAAAASVIILLAAGIWWWQRPVPTEQYAQQPTETPKATPLPTQPNTEITPPTPQLAAVTPATPVMPNKRKTGVRKTTAPTINAEEEQAMQEIKAALALVSSKLKKGRKEAVKGTEHLENVDRIFKKKRDGEG